MTASGHFASRVLERLATVAPIAYKNVFAGMGLYHQDVLFALVVRERLYFRTDDASRDRYLARNMPAFKPGTISNVESAFYQLPEDVLASNAELVHWMHAAIAAAHLPEPLTGPNAAVEDLLLPTQSQTDSTRPSVA